MGYGAWDSDEADAFPVKQRAQRLRLQPDLDPQTPLALLNLSGRLRHHLKALGIVRLGEAVRLEQRALLGRRNFGKRSLNELEALLSRAGLKLGAPFESLGPRVEPRAVTDACIHRALRRIIELFEPNDRNRKLIVRWFNLGGSEARTFAELGREFGFTRANARQLIIPFRRRVESASLSVPVVEQLLELAERLAPASAECIEASFWDRGLTERRLTIGGLFRFVDLLGLPRAIDMRDVLGGEYVASERHVPELKRVLEVARSRSRVVGICAIEDVLLACNAKSVTFELVVDCLSGDRTVWFDSECGWFYIPEPRNWLPNWIRRGLAGVGELSVEDLRTGLLRNCRTSREGRAKAEALSRVPPQVLAEFCATIEGVRVRGDMIVQTTIPTRSLTRLDRFIIEQLRGCPEGLRVAELCRRARSRRLSVPMLCSRLFFAPYIEPAVARGFFRLRKTRRQSRGAARRTTAK